MRLQRCVFKVLPQSDWQKGVAFLGGAFDELNVSGIIDSEGQPVGMISDYNLVSGPLCYLDTEYTP